MAGTYASGRYILGALLGRGGMAEVFAGQALGSEGFQKPVAIKRLLPELAGDESFVARLVAEAKLVVGMQHSNIVGVLDLVRDGDDVFVVMEYVDGPSLRQLMQARGGSGAGPLSLGLATHIVAAAGAGLEFAHARESGAIVHADVSPSNLLLTLSGEVKVADFGIARRAGTGGAVEGKWAYMPPEQARGEPLDARADVFALGVVLYELVTGAHPYAGRVKRSLPPEIEPVVMRAISDEAKHRFARVQELIDALVEVRFRHGWREGASELREAIRAARPRTAELTQARTQITGKPVTVMTSSLLVPDLATSSAPRARSPSLPAGEIVPTVAMRPRIGPRPALPLVPPPTTEHNLPTLDLRGRARRRVAAGVGAVLVLALIVALAIPALSPPPPLAAAPARAPAAAPAQVAPLPEPVLPPPPEIEIVDDEPAPEPAPAPETAPARKVAPKTPARAARRKPTAPKADKPGTLRVHAEPWAYVEVAGQHVETPARITLPPGKHKVKLHNPETGARATRWVRIEPGGLETLSVQMEGAP